MLECAKITSQQVGRLKEPVLAIRDFTITGLIIGCGLGLAGRMSEAKWVFSICAIPHAFTDAYRVLHEGLRMPITPDRSHFQRLDSSSRIAVSTFRVFNFGAAYLGYNRIAKHSILWWIGTGQRACLVAPLHVIHALGLAELGTSHRSDSLVYRGLKVTRYSFAAIVGLAGFAQLSNSTFWGLLLAKNSATLLKNVGDRFI